MGCGNSRSATIATPPQAKPGGTSNEGNNNQSGSERGKISPQNNGTATQNTQETAGKLAPNEREGPIGEEAVETYHDPEKSEGDKTNEEKPTETTAVEQFDNAAHEKTTSENVEGTSEVDGKPGEEGGKPPDDVKSSEDDSKPSDENVKSSEDVKHSNEDHKPSDEDAAPSEEAKPSEESEKSPEEEGKPLENAGEPAQDDGKASENVSDNTNDTAATEEQPKPKDDSPNDAEGNAEQPKEYESKPETQPETRENDEGTEEPKATEPANEQQNENSEPANNKPEEVSG